MMRKLRSKLLFCLLLAAACVAQTADVSGKWHFIFQTQDGTREFDAIFKQDGDKVSGKWADTADVKGSFSGSKLSLEFPYNSEEVGPGTLKIDGDLSGDALTGDWSFQTYDGTFRATRAKATAE